MKTIVFIFVPIVVERTEIRVAVAAQAAEMTRDEIAPFWTWFLPNPLPPQKDHQ
jgi:hypothetical protein